jgi:AraC-like DNA-binding protein
VRSIIRDNSKLSKTDLLHFALFFISLMGLIPFIFSSSAYRLLVASEMKSETWDLAKFEINKIIPHLADQVICLLQTIFYAVHQWILVLTKHRRWKKSMLQLPQYKLIHKWLLTFITIYAVVAINYFVIVVCIWLYDEKSEFLARANIFLLFASIIFMAVNLSVLVFPQILYGLPQEKIAESNTEMIQEPEILENEKQVSQLFSDEYISIIELALGEEIRLEKYTDPDYKLIKISIKSLIPVHHFSYYFNNVKSLSFSDWRNNLRIDYSKAMIDKNASTGFTLNAIAAKSGFTTPSTFFRAFKQATGKTPREYMKEG